MNRAALRRLGHHKLVEHNAPSAHPLRKRGRTARLILGNRTPGLTKLAPALGKPMAALPKRAARLKRAASTPHGPKPRIDCQPWRLPALAAGNPGQGPRIQALG